MHSLLREYPVIFNGSGTGSGKTYMSAAVAAELGRATLAVVPLIAQTSWRRAAARFNDSISTVGYEKLVAGNTLFGRFAVADRSAVKYFQCKNCQCKIGPDSDPCYCRPDGKHELETKSRKRKRGAFTFAPEIELLIFDEFHRCSGVDSRNYELLAAARRQNIPTICLSATPAAEPMNMKAAAYALDLCHPDNFYRWLHNLGYQRTTWGGWQWLVGEERQRRIMQSLHTRMFVERGIRLRTEDIPGFPERRIEAELYDTGAEGAINDAYNAIAGSLAKLRDRVAGYKDPSSGLSERLAEHQKVELLKVRMASELGRDYLAKGHTVIYFVNYKLTLEELRREFATWAPVVIAGGQSDAERDEQLRLLQHGGARVALVNNHAGGACCDMHDLYGDLPRVGLVFPCDSATTMLQVFGRLHRDGAKSLALYKVLLAADTVEEDIFKNFEKVRSNINALTDNDLRPELIRQFRIRKTPD